MLATQLETVRNLFAQGLAAASAAELEGLERGLAELGLAQPATLAGQVRQHLTDGRPTPQDVDSLIKLHQVLMQAEVRLCRPARVEVKRLVPVRHCLFLPAAEPPGTGMAGLEALLTLPPGIPRAHALAEWLRRASPEELARAVEIVWFDGALTAAILDGLGDRLVEALALASQAFAQDNLVMRHTALRLLVRVARDPAHREAALAWLRGWLAKAKPPLSLTLEWAIAEAEGHQAECRQAEAARRAAQSDLLAQLKAAKKGDRLKAVKALAKTRDPVFTDDLIPLLYDTELEVARAAPDALFKIGAFAALPWLHERLTVGQDWFASEALWGFGDRRALDYFIISRRLNYLGGNVAFSDFGLLAVHPLLTDLRRLPLEPARLEPFRQGILSLFNVYRSEAFALKVWGYAESDPPLAERLRFILDFLYPVQCARVRRAGGGRAGLRETLLATVGDNPQRMIANLRHGYLVKQVLFAPDGRSGFTLDTQGTVAQWDCKKWKKLAEFGLKHRSNLYFYHQIALTPDGGRLLVTNNQGYQVEVLALGRWDAPVASLAQEGQLYSVAVSADGRHAFGGGAEEVRVWALEGGAAIARLGGHRSGVECLLPAPTAAAGWSLVSGDREGLLQVWDRDWGKRAEFRLPGLIPGAAAVSPDGRWLCAIATPAQYLQTEIQVWDATDWRETARITVQSPAPIACLAFTPDGRYLMLGSGQIKFVETGSWREVLALPNNDTRALAMAPDGRTVIAGTNVWLVDFSDCVVEGNPWTS